MGVIDISERAYVFFFCSLIIISICMVDGSFGIKSSLLKPGRPHTLNKS